MSAARQNDFRIGLIIGMAVEKGVVSELTKEIERKDQTANLINQALHAPDKDFYEWLGFVGGDVQDKE